MKRPFVQTLSSLYIIKNIDKSMTNKSNDPNKNGQGR